MDRERRDLSCSASRCTWIHVRARSARDSVLVAREKLDSRSPCFSPFLCFRSVGLDRSIDRSD